MHHTMTHLACKLIQRRISCNVPDF
uniref:Uncharacterized protein n=1 Tax=Arundo donax TaxID=35708 RepID=A0A0A8ZWG9_ARUDO